MKEGERRRRRVIRAKREESRRGKKGVGEREMKDEEGWRSQDREKCG